MPPRTILLFSSDHVGWTEVRAILRDMPEVRIVGDTGDLRQAAGVLAAARPELVIAEASIGGASTVALLLDHLGDSADTTTRVLVVAARYEPAHLPEAALDLVVGYLLWGDLSRAALRHGLAALVAGDVVLGSRAVARGLLAALRGPRPPAPPLTDGELAVLRLLAEGLTNRAIAARTGVSERSVERTVANLERKLGAANKFALAVRATRLGLIG